MNKRISLLAVAFAVTAGMAYAADDKPAAEKKAPTAQQTKMKECNAQAGEKALKGDERKAFMKECLSAKPEKAATQQDKMKACNKEAGDKGLKGSERKTFMSTCLKGEPQ